MAAFLICLLLLFLLQNCVSLQCLNEDGQTVDWWFIYKVNDGLKYTYYDAKSDGKSLIVVHDKILSDTNTAIGTTLNQIWKDPKSYDWIAYNDEPPFSSSTESYGHTKGVFGYDAKNENGYFLIHSWPKFPNFVGDAYNVDIASTEYAQTYLCISYKSYNTMNSIAFQIRYNKPKVYNTSNTFNETNNFTEILHQKWLANTSIYSFQTINNVQSFTHFAKSNQWDNDLYEYLVSPYYKQSFIWETWRRNPQEPSFCKPHYEYNELNVEAVILSDGTAWKYTQDHGKSGCSMILQTSDKPLICVGDINRMYSQYNRGGGTACFLHENLWNAFNASFNNHDTCDSNGNPIVKRPKIHPHHHHRHNNHTHNNNTHRHHHYNYTYKTFV